MGEDEGKEENGILGKLWPSSLEFLDVELSFELV